MATICVVDDDKVFRELLTTILDLEGYQSVVLSEPETVVPTVRQVKPSLILMDVHISHGDTLPILKEIKADETLKTVPVVMTSGMDRSDECLAAGADKFILKPFRPAEMLAVIADLVL
jgi:DNA-binding response OmpR family regulator